MQQLGRPEPSFKHPPGLYDGKATLHCSLGQSGVHAWDLLFSGSFFESVDEHYRGEAEYDSRNQNVILPSCMAYSLVTITGFPDIRSVASVRDRRPCAQVLAVTYDFSGAAARLVAVKVAGDNCIPPGRAVWTVLAAPEVNHKP